MWKNILAKMNAKNEFKQTHFCYCPNTVLTNSMIEILLIIQQSSMNSWDFRATRLNSLITKIYIYIKTEFFDLF